MQKKTQSGPIAPPPDQPAPESPKQQPSGQRSSFAACCAAIRERLRKRRAGIRRRIEYRRLKRIRKKTVPKYVHCKNCGEKLQGMYCHRCGQYALDIEQPFWKYIKQYCENVYQFDSKVWQTLHLLFRRPGFLTEEFNTGRINSYVHPLRLFMFLSVLFFFFSFSFVPDDPEEVFQTRHDLSELRQPEAADELLAEIEKERIPYRTIRMISPHETFRGLERFAQIRDIPGQDTLEVSVPALLIREGYLVTQPGSADSLYWDAGDPRKPADATANPEGDLKKMRRKVIYDETVRWISQWLPVVVMLLIPVFALLLKGFFRKKKRRYMSHFVLALHLHSVLLILLSLYIVWVLACGTSLRAAQMLMLVFLAWLMLALHRIYGDGWIKTFVKTVLLAAVYSLMVSIVLLAIICLAAVFIAESNADLILLL